MSFSPGFPNLAVKVQDVSKKYRLYEKPSERLKDALLPFGRRSEREFWALRDVSFNVRKGQAFGIIGRNGCGKSTLLQMICGILKPTGGVVEVNGRVSALLELGAGFHPEYTGRSNVNMNLALVGFPPKEIESRMQMIEDFAEIGDFIDQPVRVYSSGMFVRLAFACAVAVDPEILVVDEALGVGDIFFQQKCFARIREIIAGGATCLFVSHDTAPLLNLCDEILLLEAGRINYLGEPEEAIGRYYASMGTKAPRAKRAGLHPPTSEESEGRLSQERAEAEISAVLQHNVLAPGSRRYGARGVEVTGLRITDTAGRDTLATEMLGALRFSLVLECC